MNWPYWVGHYKRVPKNPFNNIVGNDTRNNSKPEPGAFLKIKILAGFAANQGYLPFPVVVTLAFCGGTLGDQIFFFLGRYYGAPLLSRFPSLSVRAEPVNQLIQRYHASLIVGVRFMYGLRIAGPISIGMSDVEAWRFVLFNLLGAAVWAMLIAGAGFLFGQPLQWMFTNIKQYEKMALLLTVVVAIGFGLVRWLHLRRQ